MSKALKARRSALYVPAANARALARARELAADVVILDLEDAVAPQEKSLARERVVAAVRDFAPRELVIRINGAGTPWHDDDMAAAVQAAPDAILLPKVTGASEIAAAKAKCGGIPLWAMIEMPRAVLNAVAIADSGVACLLFGTNDLVNALQLRHRADRSNLATAMALTVLAARATGITVLDGVHNDLDDPEGFAAACEAARDFGFDGKSVIHPSQVPVANQAFTPTSDEVAYARRVLAAFAAEPDKSVITLDRRMLETLDAQIAARVIARAQA